MTSAKSSGWDTPDTYIFILSQVQKKLKQDRLRPLCNFDCIGFIHELPLMNIKYFVCDREKYVPSKLGTEVTIIPRKFYTTLIPWLLIAPARDSSLSGTDETLWT